MCVSLEYLFALVEKGKLRKDVLNVYTRYVQLARSPVVLMEWTESFKNLCALFHYRRTSRIV
jgi:hypothetical protein